MRRRMTHKVHIFKPGKRILQRNPYMILEVMLQLVKPQVSGFFFGMLAPEGVWVYQRESAQRIRFAWYEL